VKSVNVEYDEAAGSLRFPVAIELYPERLRAGAKGRAQTSPANHNSEVASRAFLDGLVAHGLRAELRSGNLLTGQKFIALDMHQDPPAAKIIWTEKPAVLPTVPGGLDEIQDSIGSIARKLDKVPFDQISYRLQSTLSTLEQTLKSADHLLQNVDSNIAPQVQATLGEARAALQNAKEVLSAEAPLRSDLGTTLLQVSRAAQSLNALLDYLQRHPESLLRGKPGDSP
jgi:paraquat-inducible protein B